MKPNNDSAFKHMSHKNLPFVSKYSCRESTYIMAVYLPEDISLQREKAHQGHAVMLREAFLRQHRPLLHVHNATIQSVLPVTSPARNIT